MTPSSDARTKWRKRKRDPHVSRRQKHEEDEEDDDDVDDELDADADDDNEQQPQHGPQSGAVPDPAPLMREVLSDGAVRISDFPSVVKHTVNRPHSSVLAIVGTERAIQFGDTRNQQSPMFLENISHGQLQALSAVPADSPSLATSDQERSDGGGYVVAPPQIMEGRGVIKRFWNGRVHAVPMHSGYLFTNLVSLCTWSLFMPQFCLIRFWPLLYKFFFSCLSTYKRVKSIKFKAKPCNRYIDWSNRVQIQEIWIRSNTHLCLFV